MTPPFLTVRDLKASPYWSGKNQPPPSGRWFFCMGLLLGANGVALGWLLVLAWYLLSR